MDSTSAITDVANESRIYFDLVDDIIDKMKNVQALYKRVASYATDNLVLWHFLRFGNA